MNAFRVVLSIAVVVAIVGCSSSTGGTGGGSGGGNGGSGGAGGGGKGGGSGGGSGGGTGGGSGVGGGSGGGSGGGAGGGAGGGSGGGSADAGYPACLGTYAGGCANPQDLRDGGSTVTIDWAAVFGASHCVKVKAGQSVAFTNVGGFHPMEQDCGPVEFISAPQGSDFTQQFTAGIYGLHCSNHGSADGLGSMNLAVQVVP